MSKQHISGNQRHQSQREKEKSQKKIPEKPDGQVKATGQELDNRGLVHRMLKKIWNRFGVLLWQ